VQQAVMETVRELQRSERFTALLISHDLGMVLESASRVLVMHDGELVEDADADAVITASRSDYTRMLLAHYADPRADVVHVPGIAARKHGRTLDDAPEPRAAASQAAASQAAASQAAASRAAAAPTAREAGSPVVLTDVVKLYRDRRRRSETRAVDGVTLTLEPASSTALVGASGSGKSTLARLITGIERPTSGSVLFGDRKLNRMRGGELRALHGQLQLVFQDPYAALNPVHTVEYTLLRPVLNYSRRSRREAREHVLYLLDRVGLTPVETFAAKLPHQLSGGQRQRVVIARALASDPQMIVADEPVSMLDVSLRAGVLALLESLRQDLGVGLLYITHDLLSARLITDRIVVMSDGSVVEEGDTAEVLQRPAHKYTVRLLDAVPVPGRRSQTPGAS
jgi:peptide/nickel transport system ATP-binding protein